jgi:hypothetical protein
MQRCNFEDTSAERSSRAFAQIDGLKKRARLIDGPGFFYHSLLNVPYEKTFTSLNKFFT